MNERNERLEILTKIDELEDKHCASCTFGSKERNRADSPCVTSCKTGKKLIKLGQELSSDRKTERIMAKGEDMTIQELEYLLSRGTTKKDIFKALGYGGSKGRELIRMLESAGAL